MTTRPSKLAIYSQNRISKYDTITASTGQSGVQYLTDQKRNPAWLSVGSSDAVQEQMNIQFKDFKGDYQVRNVDTIMLMNTNIKALQGQIIDSAGYYWSMQLSDGSQMTGPYSGTDLIIPLATVMASRYPQQVLLYLQTTQTANEEKKIGELKLCQKILTVNGKTTFDQSGEAKEISYRVADGSLIHASEYIKRGGTLSIENLSMADFDTLMAAITANDFLTFYLYGDYAPSEVFEASVTLPVSRTFDRTTQLYSVELELKER